MTVRERPSEGTSGGRSLVTVPRGGVAGADVTRNSPAASPRAGYRFRAEVTGTETVGISSTASCSRFDDTAV